MDQIPKIVLTGGLQGGKSTSLRAIAKQFGKLVTRVPEVATILLGNGFPEPGKDVEWSEEWQAAFQAAVLPLQIAMEDAYTLVALARGSKLIVCDRGLLDGAAFTPGGQAEFCRRYGIDLVSAMARYVAVLHLESISTIHPSKYGKFGNKHRFEPLERAQKLEYATRDAWNGHPRHIIIDGRRGMTGKKAEVIGIVKSVISEVTFK